MLMRCVPFWGLWGEIFFLNFLQRASVPASRPPLPPSEPLLSSSFCQTRVGQSCWSTEGPWRNSGLIWIIYEFVIL